MVAAMLLLATYVTTVTYAPRHFAGPFWFSLEPPASASLKPRFVRPEARFEQKHWCRDRFI